jgi:glutamate-5-semialdehyde dehydrogenase
MPTEPHPTGEKIPEFLISLGKKARAAAARNAYADPMDRDRALELMLESLKAARARILAGNEKDMAQARENGMSPPLLKRLEITPSVLDTMEKRLAAIATQSDPVGRLRLDQTMPSGLQVQQISTPLGVIGMIYESRPNVTTDAAAVCVRSGNAAILKGGSEAIESNRVIVEALRNGLESSKLSADSVQLIDQTGHHVVRQFLAMQHYVDALIPRGGRRLIEEVETYSRIPVIRHYDGICHLYLAEDAPEEMAIALTINSKCQRPEVCNALETLLVDAACAERLLPPLARALAEQHVELRGCPVARRICPEMLPATEEDWSTEYLDAILSIRVVQNFQEAIEHIETFGSRHTDGIVTNNNALAADFVRQVDSASVLINASTRLSGGEAYGLGGVIGISTGKLHARGPVAAEHLVSYKWVAYGQGHLRK